MSAIPPRARRCGCYSYQNAADNRKHPIRGLWRRTGKFYARLTVEEADDRKKIQWDPLTAATPAEAQAELRTLLVERAQNNLRQLSRSPLFTDYLNKTYLPLLATSGKTPATIVTEKTRYKRWDAPLGAALFNRRLHPPAEKQTSPPAGAGGDVVESEKL